MSWQPLRVDTTVVTSHLPYPSRSDLLALLNRDAATLQWLVTTVNDAHADIIPTFQTLGDLELELMMRSICHAWREGVRTFVTRISSFTILGLPSCPHACTSSHVLLYIEDPSGLDVLVWYLGSALVARVYNAGVFLARSDGI